MPTSPNKMASSQSQVKVIQNYINGQFTNSTAFLDSFNPSTGEVHAHIPNGTAEDVNNAVKSAAAALRRTFKKPSRSLSLKNSVKRARKNKIKKESRSLLEDGKGEQTLR